MNGAAARFLRLGASLAGLVLLAWIVTGQAAKPAKHRVSLPTDWSHRHAIFSQPQTAEESARLAAEPRYWQQLYRRQLPTTAVASAPKTFKAVMHRDWAIDLGAGATMGPGNYPAKFGFDVTTASCANDFVVYTTGLQSSVTQASVVGFNNLYSGCAGSPTVAWAYDTAGQILTSPIISLDGTQVAFAQTNAGGLGNVVILKWKAGTGNIGSPVPPTSVSPGTYQACTAPCMTTVELRDGSNVATDDTTSSVFYDYKNDIIWVGGERGWLHKITGVFNGTPAEVRSGGFPVQVTTLTIYSPVYDRVSNNVFVGGADGILYSVNAASPGVTASGKLDFGAGLVDAPIIDLTKSMLYVFASSDGGSSCTGGVACAAIYQLSTAFLTGDKGTKITVGNSVVFGSSPNPNPMYIGGFDSAFYSSAARTGNLYVCGNTGAIPTLYQVPITNGALPSSGHGTVFTALASTGAPGCSPVTDVPNPNTTGGASERIFVSVQDKGLTSSCVNAGCIFNFVDAPWRPSTIYSVGQQILDSAMQLETVVSVTGDARSGAVAPDWTISTNGGTTVDNHVTWIKAGLLTATTVAAWLPSHSYNANGRILDTNKNIEVATNTGTSGGTEPTWPTTPGSTTNDNGIAWINAGPIGTFALKEIGGTSGIIEDNVSVGTIAGTSQVYFTNLLDQPCATSGGTGGCAVQASQPALK